MIVPIAIAEASGGSSSPTALLGVFGGVIAALLAVAGLIGTWAALRVGKNAQVLSNYKTTAESWEARANGLKAEKEGLEERLEKAMSTITELQAKNSALLDLASGHPAIERLGKDMKRSFQDLTEQMSRIEGVLKGAN
jgi:phage-related minor tail protein